MQGNPYKAYQKTNVGTANQQQLIIMLYDGMIQKMQRAIYCIEDKDMEGAHKHLTKTGLIILELLSTLKVEAGGDVAKNLKELYTYSYEQIVVANLKKDIDGIKQIKNLMANLREGWAGIGKSRGTVTGTASIQTRKHFVG